MSTSPLRRLGAFAAKELREALPATILFLFLFHMVALTRAISVGDYSFTALRATTATFGALLVAKAILVAEALPVARLASASRAIQLWWRVFLFSAMVFVFRLIEEMLPLLVKHGGLADAFRGLLHETSWAVFAVTTMWVVAGVFVYCVAAEIVHAIGAEKLRRIFFDQSSRGT